LVRLDNVTIDFWKEFNGDFIQNLFVCLFALQTFLEGNIYHNNLEYYKLNQQECYEYISDIENEAYAIAKKEFSKRTKEISDFAVEVFKTRFNNDETTQAPRAWDRVEEPVIAELFNKYKTQVIIYIIINSVSEYSKYLKPLI